MFQSKWIEWMYYVIICGRTHCMPNANALKRFCQLKNMKKNAIVQWMNKYVQSHQAKFVLPCICHDAKAQRRWFNMFDLGLHLKQYYQLNVHSRTIHSKPVYTIAISYANFLSFLWISFHFIVMHSPILIYFCFLPLALTFSPNH